MVKCVLLVVVVFCGLAQAGQSHENKVEVEKTKGNTLDGSGLSKKEEKNHVKEESKQDNEEHEEGDKKEEEEVLEGVRARVVVGVETGWQKGRVEETQLVASAQAFGYDIQVQGGSEVAACDNLDLDYHLIIYLPRSEGVIQREARWLARALQDAGATIFIPPNPAINALVGWRRAVQQAAQDAGVDSLAHLVQHLHSSAHLRSNHRAQIDTHSRVFHVLDDNSRVSSDVFSVDGDVSNEGDDVSSEDDDVSSEGLHLDVTEDRYELKVEGHAPSVLLATPTSDHARALLLSLSDYLTQEHLPGRGCRACAPEGEPTRAAVAPEVVMVGVLIREPQAFLNISLRSLLFHGIHPKHVHFYVHSQVEEYQDVVEGFVDTLRREVKHVTLFKPHGGVVDEAQVRYMLLEECLRLGCNWYLHVDSTAYLNPNIPAMLMNTEHPVLAPVLRIQQGPEASFWRGMEAGKPRLSWDHAHILSDQPGARGYWHASCIRGVYAVRHDILERLVSAYTHSSGSYPDPDLVFCSTLREAGVPMVVMTAVPNTGVMVNSTSHNINTPDFLAFQSNPLLWQLEYLSKTWNAIMTGNFSEIKRPCDEVYQYPTFTLRFSKDLINIANSADKWSPARTQDPRKETGTEAVPTVDQWTSQLGLDHLMEWLFAGTFKNQHILSFPSSLQEEMVLSLVARFQPGEVAGLPQHHDAAAVTFHIYLTPSHLYQGGEMEFPKQKCSLKPEVGDVLVFPGRLTHPKILHNVTEGTLHKLIFHMDTPSMKTS
ncbi:LOW QUALITY PROTEIN: procollagen-lysine,2-oxoglutarate 5-dioxygenase 1 [Procambarus clarkii]|uniref:LOW QUALITY PROTEIN: procollagen-lysine,2-oxoglutarate 5-dioxygenase 1 n=1 Tax=Procambarus clarkii TaxID=6728 RepID=UPI003744032F